MAHEKQLANVKYRNWVKGGLALKYLKEGCEKFIDETVSDQHSKIVAAIKGQIPNAREKCNTCELPKLKPLHSKDRNGQCSSGQKPVCNCLNLKGKNVCPDKICSAMYDKIIFQHRYRSPNWKNTNIRDWFSNHWELAKCNISAGGYDKKKTAADTDCLGLLSIAINDQEIQTKLDLVIDPPHDLFSQTRKARDDIFHSSTLELDDATVQTYIDDMIKILEDKKELINRIEAVEAVKKLKQLKDDSFIITNLDEMEILKNAFEAIDEKKREALNAIEQKQNEVISEIRSSDMTTKLLQLEQTLGTAKQEVGATKSRMQILESRQDDIEAIVKDNERRLKEEMKYIFDQLKELREELEKVTNKEFHRERIAYLRRKRELQTVLIEQYEKYYITIPLQPLIPEKESYLCHVFVRPDVTLVTNTDNEETKDDEDAEDDTVTDDDAENEVDINAGDAMLFTASNDNSISYNDIFQGKQSPHRNIYLTGEAGSGKSTLYKHIIADWCNVHSNKYGNYAFDNENVLLKFELLFFVSLRHSAKETHIHEMIKNQLLCESKYASVFDEIVQNESYYCLIILDGLDEWKGRSMLQSPITNPHIPNRNNICQYTIITTTRPWKFEKILLNTSAYDLLINLNGFAADSLKEFVKKNVHYLNKKYRKEKQSEDLIKTIFSGNLETLCRTPILLTYLVSLWFDGRSLGPSRCDIYCSVINLLLNIAENKETETNDERLLLQYCHSSNDDTTFSMPGVFAKNPYCLRYKNFLRIISRFSFDLLISDALVFDETSVQQFGLTSQDIYVCQQVGIITVSRVNTKAPSRRSQIFSFPHKTLQECLAALWLTIDCSSQEKIKSFLKSLKLPAAIGFDSHDYARLIESSFLCVTGFLFGMNPEVGNYVFQELENTFLLPAIDHVHVNEFSEMLFSTPTLCMLDSVGRECITEARLCGYKDIKIHRMFYSTLTESGYLMDFDTTFIKYFVLDFLGELSSEEIEYVTKNEFPSLEYLRAPFKSSDFKTACHLLEKSSKTLQCIDIGSSITSSEATTVNFQDIHKKFLTRFQDMTNLCILHLSHAEFDHPNIEWFLHTISTSIISENLKTLSLKHIHCFEHDDQCEGRLDLSDHRLLRFLELLYIPIQHVLVNTTNLEDCKIYTLPEFTMAFTKMCIEFNLSRADKLQALTLNYPCSVQQQYELETLLQIVSSSLHLHYLSLTNVNFGEQILKLSPNNKSIEHIKLQSTSMTKDAFCIFIDSIPANCKCAIANLIIVPREDYDAAIEYAGNRIERVQNIDENRETEFSPCCFI